MSIGEIKFLFNPHEEIISQKVECEAPKVILEKLRDMDVFEELLG